MNRPSIDCQLNRILQCLALAAGISSPAGSALESDGAQPLQWSADGDSIMDISGNIRTLTMSENVRITQGSMVLQGNEAIIEYRVDTNELTRVTVYGTPVQYEQQLNIEGDRVTGNGDTVIYFTDESGDAIIELTGNANIRSPDSTMRCRSITYLSDQDLIREAAGPCSGALNRQGN